MAHHRDDAPLPKELYLAQMCEKYGVESIIHRPLFAREVRDYQIAMNVDMYLSLRTWAVRQTDGAAAWDRILEQYPNANTVLEWAENEYKEMANGR